MDSGETRSKRNKTSTRRARVRAGSVPQAAASDGVAISSEARYQMIAEAAYYRAERRRFLDGDPLQDWLEAEAEVANRLQTSPRGY
jgi:hypothetical protein